MTRTITITAVFLAVSVAALLLARSVTGNAHHNAPVSVPEACLPTADVPAISPHAIAANDASTPESETVEESGWEVAQPPDSTQPHPESPPQIATPHLSEGTDLNNAMSTAQASISSGAYEKAILELRFALTSAIDADSRRQILSMIAQCVERQQDCTNAAVMWRELNASATSDEERAFTAIHLASLAAQQRDYASAEQQLEATLLQISSEDARKRIQTALLQTWSDNPGRIAEVASNLEMKVSANTTDEESLCLLSIIYRNYLRDENNAKRVYEALTTLKPDDKELENTLISVYQDTKEFDKAKAIYQRGLEKNPENADYIHFQIATLDAKAGKGDDAVAYAEKHLGGSEATSQQLQLVAKVYDNTGRTDEALTVLKDAEAKTISQQDRASIIFEQVDIYTRKKQYEDAEKLINIVLAMSETKQEVKSRANTMMNRLSVLQGKSAIPTP